MADKETKWTTEARNLQINFIEDILKQVYDLKKAAKELEDIAIQMMIKVNTDTKIDELTNQKKKDKKVKSKSNQHLIKCDECDNKIQIISDLEKHIKISHEDYKTIINVKRSL